MRVEQIQQRFRRIAMAQYPRLHGLSREEIYAGRMGPGGLFLASDMAERVPFERGMRVLDIGCGRGNTSIFLA
jgi:2-polyprenyl-3-methyl-5-hydroxy-6-metoxy-1,4-benzoquinol methylase